MEQGKLPWYNLQKNVVVDGEMLIDKRTGKRTVLEKIYVSSQSF